MNFFEGLQLYEIIMLFAGILIFLVLLAGLIFYLVRGKSLTVLLIAFVIPIVMIGFPAISSISFSNGKFDLQKQTALVLHDPKDELARKNLEEAKLRIESRETTNPETLTDLAKAQFILDEPDKAKVNLDKALQANPTLPAALALKDKIALIDDVEKLTNEAVKKPADPTIKNALNQKVAEIEQLPIASSDTLVKVARAQEVVGQTADAKKSVDIAVAIKPTSAPAIELQRQIDNKQLQTVSPTPAIELKRRIDSKKLQTVSPKK